MRSLLSTALLVCVLAQPAHAAGPVDPALKLGPTKPAGLAPPKLPVPSPAEADVALLRALLSAFQPAPGDVRVLAIEDLALLGDARALDPLSALLLDPDTRIQQAALATLGRFQSPRAAALLADVVRQPRTSEPLKLQALELLVLQRDPTTRAFLTQVSTGARHSARVQTAAREALTRWTPIAPRQPSSAQDGAR